VCFLLKNAGIANPPDEFGYIRGATALVIWFMSPKTVAVERAELLTSAAA
jgi:hypothetical protein